MSGNATVTDNALSNGTVSNVYIYEGYTINVVGELDNMVTANAIGVTYENGTGTVAKGSGYTVDADDKDRFTSDENYYVITRDNEVQLVEAVSEVGNDKTDVYDEDPIDITDLGMFDFVFEDQAYGDFYASDFEDADTTYTLTGGTGHGTLTTAGKLTVSKVGTFDITVTTKLCDIAPPSTQTATLTVTPKTITIVDGSLYGVERHYEDDNYTVDVNGGTLSGVVGTDDVSIDYAKAVGTITDEDEKSDYDDFGSDDDTSETFDIDITGLTLTGADADNYILKVTEPVAGEVTINKSVAYISWPAANDVYVGTETADSQLLGGKVMVDAGDDGWITVDGAFEFVDGGDNAKVGTHGYQVQFVAADSQDSSVTEAVLEDIAAARRTVYQIVEPAEVQFEVSTTGVVDAKVLTAGAEITTDDYTVTYTVWSSYPEITLVSVDFDNDNFRHAGTFESTGKQVGAYYNETATEAQELTYDVTFYEDDSETEYGSLAIDDVIPQDILILPSYTDDDEGEVIAWETTWAGVTTTYEVGTRFPQPSHDVEFVAVYAPSEFTVSGTVYGTDLDGTEYDEDDGRGLSDIGVTLMQGDQVVGTYSTKNSGNIGYYEFEDVPAGNYNIVYTRDYGTRQEVTNFVVVDGDETVNFTFTSDSADNSVLYVGEGMGAITVEDYNAAVTSAASDLTIDSVDTATSNEMISEAGATSSNMKLFYDIQLTARGDNDNYVTADEGEVIYYIPLAGIYQGKENYAVYYMDNDGDVKKLTSGYSFSTNNDLLTLTTGDSGVFAIYFENPATTATGSGTTDISETYTKSKISTTSMFAGITLGDGVTYTVSTTSGSGTATINTTTGEVTVTAVGTYTVTATTAATATTKSTVYTATLTVTPKKVTIDGITAMAQQSKVEDDDQADGYLEVEFGGSAYVVGFEYGDDVTVDLSGATGTITYTTGDGEDGYWDNETLNLKGDNIFDVDVTGLAITGDDAGNYVLNVDTATTYVLIYQDLPYFSWPTAKEVVYGTARTSGTAAYDYDDSDLYGGKVMVLQNEADGDSGVATVSETWVILEGHFEWVTGVEGDTTWDSVNNKFTADNAGTNYYYVKFVEDEPTGLTYAGETYDSEALALAAYNNATYRQTLEKTVQPVTQVVQKAQVQFSVDADTGEITAYDIDNGADLGGDYFTPMWWLQEAGASLLIGADNRPTSPDGYYLAYASLDEFEGYTNYRHAGLSVSTGKQIGSFYLGVVAETYTVTFTVEDGDTAPAKVTGQIQNIHILPTLDITATDANGEEYAKYSGWYDEATGVSYEFGERFTQLATDVTLTAVLTPVKDATISGTVTGEDLDEDHKNLEKIAVTLMQGSTLIDYTETDENGYYEFAVAAGNYNLDVTRDQYDVQNEMTVYVSVGAGENVVKDFVIPSTTQNAELLVTTGDLDVVVEGLTTLTNAIAEDIGANSTTVRLEISDEADFSVEFEDRPADVQAIQTLGIANGHTDDYMKLFVNLDLTQTIDGVSSSLTELPKDDQGDQLTLTFYIPLAGIHQAKGEYYVYRYHDGEVEILYEKDSDNADSTEYIELVDSSTLAVTAYKFSLYAVAYDEVSDTVTKPNYSSGSSSSTTVEEEVVEEEVVGATLNREDHNAYMIGYPDDTFRATDNITRAETTVMFSRLIMEEMDVDGTYTNTFTDVTSNLWYYDYIGFMEDFGIINGYGDGTFGGDEYITRAEFAVIACRFDDLSSDESCKFSDVADDHWAASAITAAAEKGWITGYEDGTFNPGAYITRAEAVTLVNRMLERYCDEDFVDNNPDAVAHFTDLSTTYWAYYQIMEASHSHDYDKDGDVETWTEVLWHIQMED